MRIEKVRGISAAFMRSWSVYEQRCPVREVERVAGGVVLYEANLRRVGTVRGWTIEEGLHAAKKHWPCPVVGEVEQ